MKEKTLNVDGGQTILRFQFIFKVAFTLALSFTMASYANAQHCEGCSVNIVGPDYVHVGDTVTYSVTPSLAPELRQSVYWDFLNFLEGYGEIIDQGRYPSDDEWVTVHFVGTGWSWFTFEANYGNVQDFDEIYIHIVQ